MNFYLAKKLYDAGYRMYRAPDRAYRGEQVVKLGGVYYLAPTLPELMKACQDSGGYYGFSLRWDKHGDNEEWTAFLVSDHDCPEAKGSNPIDAAGRLWFALNKPAINP